MPQMIAMWFSNRIGGLQNIIKEIVINKNRLVIVGLAGHGSCRKNTEPCNQRATNLKFGMEIWNPKTCMPGFGAHAQKHTLTHSHTQSAHTKESGHFFVWRECLAW
jgi:hypothetical protein